jgi:hypothetical protein
MRIVELAGRVSACPLPILARIRTTPKSVLVGTGGITLRKRSSACPSKLE